MNNGNFTQSYSNKTENFARFAVFLLNGCNLVNFGPRRVVKPPKYIKKLGKK